VGDVLVRGDGHRFLLAATCDYDGWILPYEEMSPFDRLVQDEQILVKAKREQAAREEQIEINAFHRLFKSEDGERVLAHLDKVFRLSQPAFEQSAGYNPIAAAIRDGQRGILLYIFKTLKRPCQGDANIETKPQVIK